MSCNCNCDIPCEKCAKPTIPAPPASTLEDTIALWLEQQGCGYHITSIALSTSGQELYKYSYPFDSYADMAKEFALIARAYSPPYSVHSAFVCSITYSGTAGTKALVFKPNVEATVQSMIAIISNKLMPRSVVQVARDKLLCMVATKLLLEGE